MDIHQYIVLTVVPSGHLGKCRVIGAFTKWPQYLGFWAVVLYILFLSHTSMLSRVLAVRSIFLFFIFIPNILQYLYKKLEEQSLYMSMCWAFLFNYVRFSELVYLSVGSSDILVSWFLTLSQRKCCPVFWEMWSTIPAGSSKYLSIKPGIYLKSYF